MRTAVPQCFQRDGLCVLFKIGGACINADSRILKLSGHQTRVRRGSQTNCQVIALIDKINIAVGNVDVQFYQRVLASKIGDPWQQPVVCIRRWHTDTHKPPGLGLLSGQDLLHLVDLRNRHAALLKIPVAVIGQGHAASGSPEKLDAKPVLQPPYATADRRGRQTHGLGAGSETAQLGGLAKQRDGAELAGLSFHQEILKDSRRQN